MSEPREHRYPVSVTWTGNRGGGTSGYHAYGREHEVAAAGKPVIAGSSDPAFRGDPARWNPEELLVGAVVACHQLWYLHLCADAGLVVTAYADHAEGLMEEDAEGSGRFLRVTLRPEVTIAAGGDPDLAVRLHHQAHAFCFIANSINFPVACDPRVRVGEAPI